MLIKKLFDELHIDGYVAKGREDVSALREAVNSITQNQRYYPKGLRQEVNRNNVYAFDEFDLLIVRMIYEGKSQKEISDHLRKERRKPSSLSSIEKRLAQMKEAYSFANNEQLVVYCKENGLIG